MSLMATLQGIVLALILLWSALFAAHRLLPAGSRRVQANVLAALARRPLPRWLRGLALRLQPRSTAGGSCGDGCSSCGGCAAAARPRDAVRPLPFRPHQRS
jgi:hypothetical protein